MEINKTAWKVFGCKTLQPLITAILALMEYILSISKLVILVNEKHKLVDFSVMFGYIGIAFIIYFVGRYSLLLLTIFAIMWSVAEKRFDTQAVRCSLRPLVEKSDQHTLQWLAEYLSSRTLVKPRETYSVGN